jgi:hypothetical protein
MIPRLVDDRDGPLTEEESAVVHAFKLGFDCNEAERRRDYFNGYAAALKDMVEAEEEIEAYRNRKIWRSHRVHEIPRLIRPTRRRGGVR